MTSKTWRQRWLEPLACLLRGDVSPSRRGTVGRKRVVLGLEELESRLVLSSPTMGQFTTGSETIDESTGSFSIPVTLTGAPAPIVSTFVSGFHQPAGLAFDAAGNL